MHEQVDGPLNDSYEHLPEKDVASGFNIAASSLGWFILNHDADESRPQGYRLATWVETEEDKLGHAFGLSRAKALENTAEGFNLTSKFFTVDREFQKLVEEPKTFEISTDTDFDEQINSTIETFDKTEMRLAIEMMKKMEIASVNSAFASEIDKHVGFGIALHSLDNLAEMYPGGE